MAGDAGITIEERVVTESGVLATGVIDTPDSRGSGGVFNDEKGLWAHSLGPIKLYQSFTVSVDGGKFFNVPVDLGARGMRDTLGVYFTWNYPVSFWSKDYNVFVEGEGKEKLPTCK